MILLIDNFDSFAYNLARYFQRLGQRTLVVRNNAIDACGVRSLQPAAVVLSPGPCTPQQAGSSLEIVRKLHESMPILGVCLGHQVIAEALGGHVTRAPAPCHGRTSQVTHLQRRLFDGIPSPLKVCRYHSLVVEEPSLPKKMRATAWTADGVLMAIEHRLLPLYGVQFHPEAILTEYGYELLANFLRLAGLQVASNTVELGCGELLARHPPEAPLPLGPITF